MTTSTARSNKVTISDAGPCRKKISIEIPAETVTEHLQEAMAVLSTQVAMPGFRPGKAPKAMLEKRFGEQMRNEAKSRLVGQAFQEVVQEKGLKVIGDPVSPNLGTAEIALGKPLAVDLDVEVTPEFTLPSLEGVEIKKPVIEITDEMTSNELTRMALMEGSLEERQTPEAGDYLTGHGVMTGPDGKEYYNIKGCVVQIPTADKNGKGMILGVLVDDFAAQLGLPTAGKTVTIKTTGPANHEVEAIRNIPLTAKFTVERVDRIIPASPEALATAVGLPGVPELKEAIKARMAQRVMVEQRSLMRQQLAKHLVEKVQFDLPERLTAGQAQRFLERQRAEMMYRGVPQDQIEERVAALRGASQQLAQRDLKLFFILAKEAEAQNIGVDEAEINAYIYDMARQRNVRPDALRQELIKTNQVGAIYQTIRDHKVTDFMLSQVKISEMPAAEFEKYWKDHQSN